MTSADGSDNQAIVVILTDANNKPDTTDDSGAVFNTGNLLAYDSDPSASDSVNMPALGAGAPLGLVSDRGIGGVGGHATLRRPGESGPGRMGDVPGVN